ncbi:MAG: 4-hydroxy-tetrahydrodipicolinate synthase [Proteobacteria bacterium]|nr:4-hydroxy-tetrahydrodipicolinate synthase [Pseudomonadota bacterium]
MAKERIEGSFVALITPFNKDGSVDHDGFRTLIEFQARHGTSAVLICGSTGEVSMLSAEERKEIIRRTVKFKRGGMKLYYGCSGNNTQATIDMVRFAGREGADGAIVTAPSYICAPVEDAVQYFLEVADASEIPIGIYNNPPRVKTDLTAEAIIELAKHPRIVVNKESTTRIGQCAQLARANPDISLMCCDSPNLGLVIATMSLGGHGTANMSGNIIPGEMAVVSRPWRSFADAESFRKTYLQVLPLLHFNYSAINPVAVKSLAGALGLPAGALRKPLRALPPDQLLRGIDIVRELGVAQKYGFTLKGPARAAAE